MVRKFSMPMQLGVTYERFPQSVSRFSRAQRLQVVICMSIIIFVVEIVGEPSEEFQII